MACQLTALAFNRCRNTPMIKIAVINDILDNYENSLRNPNSHSRNYYPKRKPNNYAKNLAKMHAN